MDPKPIKHPAVLLARIRDRIEPSLMAAGFQFHSRNKPFGYGSRWLDYMNAGDTISIRWDRRLVSIVAEMLDRSGRVELLAKAKLDRVHDHKELMECVEPFVAAIERWAKESPPAALPSEGKTVPGAVF